jgi:hypothetical protein
MTHNGQRPLAKERLRQSGDERSRGEYTRDAEAVEVGKVVEGRRARAEAGEVDRHGPAEPSVGSHVVARQVVRLGNRVVPSVGSGPVLAEQGPLVPKLERVAVWEAQTVTRREQQPRGLRPVQESHQIVLAGSVGSERR